MAPGLESATIPSDGHAVVTVRGDVAAAGSSRRLPQPGQLGIVMVPRPLATRRSATRRASGIARPGSS